MGCVTRSRRSWCASTVAISPYGSPEDVAAFPREYVDAGCTVFNLIPCAGEHETAVATVSELQGLLNGAG